MNPEKPSREEIEAKLTALLLGELPAEEAQLLRWAVSQDAALAQLHDRLKLTIGLVREVAAHPAETTPMQTEPPKFSDEKREKLLAHFKTTRPVIFLPPLKKRRDISPFLAMAAALALIAVLAAMLLPALSKAKNKSARIMAMNEAKEVAAQNQEDQNSASALRAKAASDNLDMALPKTSMASQTGLPAGGVVTVGGVVYATNAMSAFENPQQQVARLGWQNSTPIVLPTGGNEDKELAVASPAPSERSSMDFSDVTSIRDQNVHTVHLENASPTEVTEALQKTFPSGNNSAQVLSRLNVLDLPSVLQNREQQMDSASSSSTASGTANGNAGGNPFAARFAGGGFGGRGGNGGGGGGAGGGNTDYMASRRPAATPPAPAVAPSVSEPSAGQYAVFNNSPGELENSTVSGFVAANDSVAQGLNGNNAYNGVTTVAGGKFYAGQTMDDLNGLRVLATNKVENNRTVGTAQFAMDTDNHNLVVTADKETEDQIRKRLAELDAPSRQMLVEGRVVNVSPTNSSDSGEFITAAAMPPPPVSQNSFQSRLMSVVDRNQAEKNGVPGYVPGVAIAGIASAPAPTVAPQAAMNQRPQSFASAPMIAENELAINEKGKLQPQGGFSLQGTNNTIATADMIGGGVGRGSDLSLINQSTSINSETAKAELQPPATEAAAPSGSPQLYARTFKVDPNTFFSGLQGVAETTFGATHNKNNAGGNAGTGGDGGVSFLNSTANLSDISTNAQKIFTDLGIDTTSVAFNDKLGYLYVRATDKNLDAIERIVQTLNPVAPQASQNQAVASSTSAPTVAPLPVAAMPPPVSQNPTTTREQSQSAMVEDRPLPKTSSPAPIPQPEILTSENAFSTFSLNVSDVSFKLAAASLQKNIMPDAASIRSEEFINAFDYRDPEPKWDSASSLSAQTGRMPVPQPVAFVSERARDPFAHNRDLLRFSIKTAAAGREAGRPLNIVLLLDNSGSMERADRVAIIHEALKVLAAQLQPQDTLSIVTFARTARLWVDGARGDHIGTAVNIVGNLTPEGGTNLEEAMNLAYATARRHYLANGGNRVVLLTDGAANLGNVNPEALKQKVESFRKQGIALDCFGIGWEGYNDDLLEVLSSNGDGRYGFINTPEAATTEFAVQLAGALHVAAEDVKVQVEFNPQRVISWRQIGYAKHQLTKEQFRDNTVAAAPMAAREAGNGLYTVEVNPQGTGPVATVRVRFRVPGTQEVSEHEWQVPFDGTAPALENASPAMRLASVAAEFSEWLASSPFAQEVTPDQLLNYLNGVPQIYGADPRPKQLETMIREAKSLSGK